MTNTKKKVDENETKKKKPVEKKFGIIEAISIFHLDKYKGFVAKKKFNLKVLSHSAWSVLFSKNRII